MSGWTKRRKIASSDSGTLSPNPWDLTLSRQNVWCTVEGTRTEDRAPQGCDPSAASRAGMARDGFDAGAVPKTTKQTPPDISLLRAKNGLDNGVHFKGYAAPPPAYRSPNYAETLYESNSRELTRGCRGTGRKDHGCASGSQVALHHVPPIVRRAANHQSAHVVHVPNRVLDASTHVMDRGPSRLRVRISGIRFRPDFPRAPRAPRPDL
jgi:hypothetical protein